MHDEVLAAILIGLLGAIFLFILVVWHQGKKEEKYEGLRSLGSDPAPIIECQVCDKPLDKNAAHVISDVQMGNVAGEQLPPGAGTAISSDWCSEHCPGGCQFEREGSSA